MVEAGGPHSSYFQADKNSEHDEDNGDAKAGAQTGQHAATSATRQPQGARLNISRTAAPDHF